MSCSRALARAAATATLFLAALLPVGLTAQTITWDGSSGLLPWDDAIPADQRFVVSGVPSQASLAAGALHVDDDVLADSISISKTDLPPGALEGDWEIEAVVRMNACDRVDPAIDLGTQAGVHGSGHYVSFGIDEEGVGFVGIPSTGWVADLKYLVDLSDDFHTFRCVKAGGQVSLYLDAQPTPVISLPFTSFPEIGSRLLLLGATSIVGTSDWDQTSFRFEAGGAWTDLGAALAGTGGPPLLVGEGALEGGDPFALTLTAALPGATTYFVLGFARIDVPFKGGVMVPALTPPNGLYVPLPVAPDGTLALGGTWPVGLPSGTSIYVQHWVVDPSGPFGFAASNAVQGTTP